MIALFSSLSHILPHRRRGVPRVWAMEDAAAWRPPAPERHHQVRFRFLRDREGLPDGYWWNVPGTLRLFHAIWTPAKAAVPGKCSRGGRRRFA
jgi:hypothetical protein